jgi:acetyl-CoA synthetase
LKHRQRHTAAMRDFRWPLDYFDGMACGNDSTALWIVGEDNGE